MAMKRTRYLTEYGRETLWLVFVVVIVGAFLILFFYTGYQMFVVTPYEGGP
jgi:hypothetical protein